MKLSDIRQLAEQIRDEMGIPLYGIEAQFGEAIINLIEAYEMRGKALEHYASCPKDSGLIENIINGGEYVPLGTMAESVLDHTKAIVPEN